MPANAGLSAVDTRRAALAAAAIDCGMARRVPAMKQALFVHYHFLPVHNVAVAQLLGYAQHLPAFGWRPLVLTKTWRGIDEADPSWGLSWEPELERESGCAIHRVAEPPGARPRRAVPASPPVRPASQGRLRTLTDRSVAELGRLRRMLFGDYPDEFISWVDPAVAAGIALARHERIDLVMSYCPPETNHLVGRRLARHLGVPWVPFFGDLYGFFAGGFHPLAPEGYLRRAYHQWCLAPAAACAAVSPYMVEYLARTYRKPTELVLAGCAPVDAASATDEPAPGRGRFIVSHIGSLYPGDQRPELFFDGLDRLLARQPQIASQLEVRFVGSKCEERLRAMLDGRRAASVCAIQPKVDSTTARALVRSSHALLAFTCTAHRDRHGTMSYPTKLFEALSARRPTLAIPADGDWVDELLARTNGGTGARDADEVAARLGEWFRAWQRDGRVPFHGRAAELAALSCERQVERLARLFDAVGHA
jgi:hypothetical protein